jgi:hypothetical protein
MLSGPWQCSGPVTLSPRSHKPRDLGAGDVAKIGRNDVSRATRIVVAVTFAVIANGLPAYWLNHQMVNT